MNKVLLVMDEKKTCGECLLASTMNESYIKCRKMNRCYSANSKPEWCPIKPLPKKQELSFFGHGQDMIAMGWNAAIEEIEGKV